MTVSSRVRACRYARLSVAVAARKRADDRAGELLLLRRLRHFEERGALLGEARAYYSPRDQRHFTVSIIICYAHRECSERVATGRLRLAATKMQTLRSKVQRAASACPPLGTSLGSGGTRSC